MGEIFVGDTDLLTMLQDIFSVSKVLTTMQTNLNKWANLLIATGGALNPSKCYWYLIAYKCIDGKWEYNDDRKCRLSIPLPDGSRTEITQLSVDEEKKMLGVWSSPKGSVKNTYKK